MTQLNDRLVEFTFGKVLLSAFKHFLGIAGTGDASE